ncbi:MAG: DUF86 domain-containing protein [Candidatus Latescibacterota bacterium]
MVDRELVQRRLEKLDEYLEILSRLRRYGYEEFTADPEHYGSAERFLQLSIEVLSDLGNHVVADQHLGPVAVSADMPRLLAEHGLIPPDLADLWVRMIGFRNVLVYEYLEVDRRLVHQVLSERLGDFARIRSAFGRLM